jgi:hypothetical protein
MTTHPLDTVYSHLVDASNALQGVEAPDGLAGQRFVAHLTEIDAAIDKAMQAILTALAEERYADADEGLWGV